MSPIAIFRLAGIVVVLLAFLGVYVKGRHDVQEHFDSYKAAVKAIGEAQEEATRVRIAAAKERKKVADEETKRARNRLHAESKRVSELIAGFSLLPPTGAAAASSDGTCFEPDAFSRAIREFLQETAGIVIEGNQAVIDLDAAKRWGQTR